MKEVIFLRQAIYTRFDPRTWDDLNVEKNNGVHLLPNRPGVYEVWKGGAEAQGAICLYVGSSDDLFVRVRNKLIRGKTNQDHSHHDEIIHDVSGNTHLLLIRWSVCELSKVLEARFHEWYQPKYPDKDLAKGWGLDLSRSGNSWPVW